MKVSSWHFQVELINYSARRRPTPITAAGLFNWDWIKIDFLLIEIEMNNENMAINNGVNDWIYCSTSSAYSARGGGGGGGGAPPPPPFSPSGLLILFSKSIFEGVNYSNVGAKVRNRLKSKMSLKGEGRRAGGRRGREISRFQWKRWKY